MASAKSKLAKIQSIPEDRFEAYVEAQKQQIVQFHLSNNPFYQEIAKAGTYSSWTNLPILTKQDLQIPLKNRLAEGYTVKNTYVDKTAGSSGTPLIFAKSKEAHALTWAVIQDRFGWYGFDFNHSKQARFYGIPLDPLGHFKERLKDTLSHRYRFPIFNLNDEALEKMLKTFQRKRFDYINGYTSSIVLFAKYLESKALLLTDLCPSLKACIVTSEMLFEVDKVLMEKVFGVPVINEYGISEVDLIAFQNKERHFQMTSETVFTEVLDDAGLPVPYGHEGRLVYTNLYNKAHPIIRYDSGDRGVLSPASTLKEPLLERLTGRTNDIAYLPSGKVVPGLTFYYVTKEVIDQTGKVKEFVVFQTAATQFEIQYISQLTLTPQEEKNIENAIASYIEPGLNLIFKKKTSIRRQKSGKLKQFTAYNRA